MTETSRNDRATGIVLAAASIAIIIGMAYHPRGVDQPGLVRTVHGALMVLTIISFAGYQRFAARLGGDRFIVCLGLTAYGAAVAGNLLAATINGFVVPALVESGSERALMTLLWELNQALAYGGAFAASGAIALWSGCCLMRGRGADRLVGLFGLVAGLAPAFLLATGAIGMHVGGALVVYAAQALFGVAVGAWLFAASADWEALTTIK